MAETTQRSTAEGWIGAQGLQEGTDVELPSGNVALLRRIKPEAFLQQGFIPDPLTALVMKAVNDKKGLPPQELKKIAGDREKLGAAMQMMDRILCYCVLDPKVAMPPTCVAKQGDEMCNLYFTHDSGVHTDPSAKGYHQYQEGPREPGVLYSDVVAFEDKVFIFNWAAGGTADLTSFRAELQEHVGAVSSESDVPRSAKRPSRAK